MCNIDHSRYERILAARGAAEDILERYHRVRLRKAWNLSAPTGFDRAVAEFALLLRTDSAASEAAAVKAIVDYLDIDWYATTAEQRRRLVNDALVQAGRKTAIIPVQIKATVDNAAEEVVRATRADVRSKYKLGIKADFNATDKRIIKHLRTSEANFVTNEFGKRLDELGDIARSITADGLKQGLGNDAIAKKLHAAAKAKLVDRSRPYWNVVANSFIGRGRTFGTLSSFSEAGIEKYLFEAVLDEATTETCRFYHGKVFEVSRGLKLFDRVDAEPDLIKEITPWVRKGVDDDANEFLYVKQGDQTKRIADIVQSGVGSRDRLGEFRNGLNERQLTDVGIIVPPIHALCRSVISSIM